MNQPRHATDKEKTQALKLEAHRSNLATRRARTRRTTSPWLPQTEWLLPDTMIASPVSARRVAYALAVASTLFLVGIMFIPWQQTASATGRVVAFTPFDRQQTVDAPVKGVVVKWFVQEGSRVTKGQVLARLSDNDPSLLQRLSRQQDSAEQAATSYKAQTFALEQQLTALRLHRESSIAAANAKLAVASAKVQSAKQELAATVATFETEAANLERSETLRRQGLVSERQLELAKLAATKARTKEASGRASLAGALSDLAAARSELAKARASGDAKLGETQAKLEKARSELAKAEQLALESETNVERQQRQTVVSPREGIVRRLFVQAGGQQVKAGDPLVLLVPELGASAVELTVDGNDAALLQQGTRARLQFEGWPAVQFVGWPSVAVGSFGGKVAFLDAHSDANGDFRVVVLPDEDDEPWPDSQYLRQGVRAKGWFLLSRVTLAYELWRQLNGFPPVIDVQDSPQKGGGSSLEKAKESK